MSSKKNSVKLAKSFLDSEAVEGEFDLKGAFEGEEEMMGDDRPTTSDEEFLDDSVSVSDAEIEAATKIIAAKNRKRVIDDVTPERATKLSSAKTNKRRKKVIVLSDDEEDEELPSATQQPVFDDGDEEDSDVMEVDDDDEEEVSELQPRRPKTPTPASSRRNRWPVTDKLERKIEEQLRHDKAMEEKELASEDSDDELEAVTPRQKALAKLRKARERNATSGGSSENDKLQTRAEAFIDLMDGDKLQLDDLYLWQDHRDLYRRVHQIAKAGTDLPAESDWKRNKIDFARQKLRKMLVDEDEMLTPKELKTKAVKLINDPQFEKKTKPHLKTLPLWVKKQKLHSMVLRLLKLTPATDGMWARAEERLIMGVLEEHEAMRDTVRQAIVTVLNQTDKEDLKTLDKMDEEVRNEDREIMRVADGGSVEQVVDFSEPRCKKKFRPCTIVIGEGFSLVNDMVTFNTAGQHGTYEAVSVVKTMPPNDKVKTPRDLAINMPVRNIPALTKAVKAMRAAIDEMKSLPSTKELAVEIGNDANRLVDLSERTDMVPRIKYKLDELLSLSGERVTWGKASVEVITFLREAKDKTKKGFSLQIPAKCFPALELAVEYLNKVCLRGNE